MLPDDSHASTEHVLHAAWAFLRDFASFAGRKGVWGLGYIALGAVLESVGLVLIIPLLGIVIGGNAASGKLQRIVFEMFAAVSVHTATGRLALLLAIFSLLIVLRNVVIIRRDVTLAELQMGFVEAQRSRVMKALATARWEQVVRLRHARITHLMSGDIQRIGNAAHFMLQFVVSGMLLLAQTVLAFALAPLLALLAFFLLIVGGFALIPVLRRARSLGSLVTNANLALLNSTTQFLGGLKLAISQNLQSSFVTEFEETVRGLKQRQLSYIRQQTGARLTLATLSAIVGAVAILIGYEMLGTTPSVLITFLLILARMSGPATQIQQGAQQFAHSLPAYEKVKDLMAELGAGDSVAAAPVIRRTIPDGAIELRHVSFAHPGAADENGQSHGVQDIDLTIARAEFVGVMGSSGAGKTTFADLLSGLFSPQAGEISIGGVTLDDTTMADWRAQVSYVPQDAFLFHDTVRRNLSWANPASSEQEMWNALAIAGADDLVRRMEHGLDTIMGERGTLISGGERQRVALARAILRRPRFLLLDEATSAIDVETEQAILHRLRAFLPRATIVLIAHRNESLALCSRTLRFEGGRLV